MRFYSISGCSAATILVLLSTGATAQQPTMDDALARLGTYLLDYEQKLSAIAASEGYEQQYSYSVMTGTPRVTRKRTLQSDFIFLRLPGDLAWMGFRDTFLVDGGPVRNHELRLQQVLSGGADDALGEALRIVTENTRYNLGDISRTINVPTQTLDLLHPRNRSRFTFHEAGTDRIDGRRLWRIDFTEAIHPTIIHTREGADQPARGSAWVDPGDGAVVKTVLDLGGDRAADFVQTKITVLYHRDSDLGLLVPYDMVEHYYRRGDIASGRTTTEINAHATYTDFRQFQTSVRIVTDPPRDR